jgi:diguanylate cyclase (GGDEF)-like protein
LVVSHLPATSSRRFCGDEGPALRPVSDAGAPVSARRVWHPHTNPADTAARRASLLGELFSSVASATAECDVLDAAARQATEWIGDMCNIFMLSDDREWFELAANQAGESDAGESLARTIQSTRLPARDGVAGRVLASGRPFFGPVGSHGADSGLMKREQIRFVAQYPIASLVAVPMMVRDEIIGVFELARITDSVPYTEDDVEFIVGIASRTAMAYDNLRSRRLVLIEATRGRILAEFLATAAEATDEKTVLDALAAQSADAVGAACIILRATPDGSALDMAAVASSRPAEAESIATILEVSRWNSAEGVAGEAFQSGETVVRSFLPPGDQAAYIASLPPERRRTVARLDLRAIFSVPLQADGRRLGVLVLSRDGEGAQPFDAGDVAFGQAIAGRAVLALERLIERQRADDELRHLAYVDELTGLANRRAAERAIASRLGSLGRHGWSFGLLVVDVDHLKLINDRHGHAVGDSALRLVAHTIAWGSRSEDVVGRWGGDEFVVLVSAADPGLLAQASRRIQALVSRSHLRGESGQIRLSISVGASVARADDTVEALFERADQALYEAKSTRSA